MILKDNILVVLPAYNEATVISEVISSVHNIGYYNVLVVDDGSDDGTYSVAISRKARVIKLIHNCGVGAATKAAILYAQKNSVEYLVFMDADGQHYADDIDNLANCMCTTNADLVIGSRFINSKDDVPRIRKFYNRIANIITNAGRFKVTDSQSGFRMLNRKAISTLNLQINGYGVCTEMIWKSNMAKLVIKETPIKVRYTKYSMSKGQNLWKGISTGISLLKKH